MKNSPPVSPKRQGLARIWFATVYSWQGLYAAWFEPAFRQEALICLVGVPAAFWLGQNWLETGFLIACLAFVLVVELLNTGMSRRLTGSALNGTTCPNVPRTWAARQSTSAFCCVVASGSAPCGAGGPAEITVQLTRRSGAGSKDIEFGFNCLCLNTGHRNNSVKQIVV